MKLKAKLQLKKDFDISDEVKTPNLGKGVIVGVEISEVDGREKKIFAVKLDNGEIRHYGREQLK